MQIDKLYKRMNEAERQQFDFLFDYSFIDDLKEFVREMEEKYGKEK